MAARDDVFRQALAIPPPGAVPPGPVSPAAAVFAFGGGTTGRTELAMALAGTRNRRSTAYKSALRNVQRWERGRAPTGASQARLNAIDAYRRGAMADAAHRLRRLFRFTMRNVRLAISESRRTVPWINEDVRPADIADASADFRDLLQQGREAEAFDALEETLLLAYNLDREDTIEELDQLIIQPY